MAGGGGGGGYPLVTAAVVAVTVGGSVRLQSLAVQALENRRKGRRASWSRLLPVVRSLPKPTVNERGGGGGGGGGCPLVTAAVVAGGGGW